MRIALKRVMIEPSGFRQIRAECDGDPDKIRSRIMDIIAKRGKLHNPVTGTGGVLYGIVDRIGGAYENRGNLSVGDPVICNSSLASIPLWADRIGGIDMAFGFVSMKGSAILFSRAPVVKKPPDIPANLLMVLSNESGTLYNLSKAAVGKKDFLVIGDQMIMNLIFGRTIRKAAGRAAHIVCLLDRTEKPCDEGTRLKQLMGETFDEIHETEIHKPTVCIADLNLDARFDLAVNCANIPGGETINVVATRNGGVVIFANIINNYGEALYMTEAISRDLDVRVADGYLEKYAEYDLKFAAEIAPAFEDVILEGKAFEEYSAPRHAKRSGGQRGGRAGGVTDDMVFESEAMEAVVQDLLRVAKYDCNVLITGETGTGKEKAAAILFRNSARNMRPWIRVNCAAISPHLLESEFFGYEQGAFTGASGKGKRGFFEMADQGTIFLDEIGELPLDLQAKLLRVIQDGEFFKVGGTVPVRTNVRILSATNRDPEALLSGGSFRPDLYYRLNVFPVRIPGLAERRQEIPALIAHFMRMYNDKFGLGKTISQEAVHALRESHWPGNIRELENMVQRLLISSAGEIIGLEDVMNALCLRGGPSGRDGDGDLILPPEMVFEKGTSMDLNRAVAAFEDRLIEEAARRYGSSRKAAAALGISQSQFMRKKRRGRTSNESISDSV